MCVLRQSHCVALAGLVLTVIHAPIDLVLGLKVCPTYQIRFTLIILILKMF